MAQAVEILPQVRQEIILYSQYHRCWCSGDTRSQGISNHDIYFVEPNQFSPRTLRVKGTTLFHIKSNPGRLLTLASIWSGLHELHSHYHVCWCSGDFRSQAISNYVTDPQSQNISSPASKELRSLHHFPGANELMPCGLLDSEESQYQDAILPAEGFPL